MTKLTGSEIVRQRERGTILIDPFIPENVGPNSVDLTLSPVLEVYTTKTLDMRVDNPTRRLEIPESGLWLEPGELYLGATNERAGSSYYVPGLEGRSSIARLGMEVHRTAGFGDLGFDGCWTLEIEVTKPLKIYPNIRCCQVYFEPVEGERDILYGGAHKARYTQHAPFPVRSRFYLDFDKEGSGEPKL